MSEYMHLCLTDLLDQDLTSYEYFNSLSNDMKAQLMHCDIRSFELSTFKIYPQNAILLNCILRYDTL